MADGLKTAIDLVAGEAEAPDGDGEQLDLLGLPALPAGSVVALRSGPGRPKGARNRRTQEWVDYLLSRYPSPLEGLLQIANTPALELARRAGCSLLEALQEKRIAMAAALPYLHQRQPLAVQLSAAGVIQLVIETGLAGEASDPMMFEAKIVDNQPLSEGASDEV